jgi:tetratricopeptide (TPR) repeat protein
MTREKPGTGGGRLRQWLVAALVLVALCAAGGWYAWQSRSRTEPPAVQLDAVDPEVAAAVTAARAEAVRSPRSPAAWGKFAKVLAAHGYLEEARVCFAEAERLQPDEARWAYGQGLMLVFSDNDAAIVQFQRATRLRGDPAMRLRLADTLAVQGRFDEAEEQYRLLRDDPLLAPRAELGLGRVAFERGDPSAARELLDRAAGESETRKAAHSLLAEIAQRTNDQAAAAAERAVVNKLPDDPDPADPLVAEISREKVGKNVRLARALKLSRQGEAQEAAAEFQELVLAYPDWDQGWLNYGRLLMEHRAYAQAAEKFQTVLQLTPDSVTGHFQLGVALFQRDDFSQAAQHFQQAARLKPDHALAHYNLGHCLKRMNDRDGAVAAFRQALRFRPDMARARTSLSELLAERGDKTGALEELRLCLDLNPDDETAKKLWDELGKQK